MNWENFVDIGWGEMNRKTDVLLHSPVDMEHCGRLFVVSQWESVSWQQGIRQSSIVIRGHTGREHYRIKHIRELYNIISKADRSTKKAEKLRQFLEMYGKKDYFSTWLYMHGFRNLGDELRPRRDSGQRLVTVLKRTLKREILRMKITPLVINGNEIYYLTDLLTFLHNTDPVKIQHYSDNDIFSNWLDRKGFPELAEEFRPVHGSGDKLKIRLTKIVEKWINIYLERL